MSDKMQEETNALFNIAGIIKPIIGKLEIGKSRCKANAMQNMQDLVDFAEEVDLDEQNCEFVISPLVEIVNEMIASYSSHDEALYKPSTELTKLIQKAQGEPPLSLSNEEGSPLRVIRRLLFSSTELLQKWIGEEINKAFWEVAYDRRNNQGERMYPIIMEGNVLHSDILGLISRRLGMDKEKGAYNKAISLLRTELSNWCNDRSHKVLERLGCEDLSEKLIWEIAATLG